MTRSILSAWVALRRPAVLLTALLGTAGFALLGTVVSFLSATNTTTSGPPRGPGGVTLGELAEVGGLVAGLESATTLMGVLAIALAASAFGGDFANGTVRTLLVRQPNRVAFLAGKFLAIAGILTVAAALATVVSVAAAFALAGGQGVETAAWSGGEALAGWLRVTVSMVGFAAIGGALGLLFRSPVVATGVGVGWAMAFELILTSASETAQDVLPASLLSSIADGTVTAAGSGTLVLWLGAIVGTATWTFLRRDVRI